MVLDATWIVPTPTAPILGMSPTARVRNMIDIVVVSAGTGTDSIFLVDAADDVVDALAEAVAFLGEDDAFVLGAGRCDGTLTGGIVPDGGVTAGLLVRWSAVV